MARKGTFLHGLTTEQVDALREAARVLGYTITRGAGAGREGSMAELIAALADAYVREPDRVLHFFGLLFNRPWSLPEKYRREMSLEPVLDTAEAEVWDGKEVL